MKRKWTRYDSRILYFAKHCPSVPALFVLSITTHEALEYRQTIRVTGNILDLTILPNDGSVIYSIDNTCSPFERTLLDHVIVGERRDHIGYLKFSDSTGRWQEGPCDQTQMSATIKAVNAVAGSESIGGAEDGMQKLGHDFLYSLESLRKKPGNEDLS